MKRFTVTAIVLLVTAGHALCQTTKPESVTPKTVVEKFLAIETQGGRLSPAGWRESSSFFLNPERRPHNFKILVIQDKYSVWDPLTPPSTKTEIFVEINPEGWIDSALRFIPLNRRYYKSSMSFPMTLADEHQELGVSIGANQEIPGAKKWLIDSPLNQVTLNVNTAMRYVEQNRDKTTDPQVKKNADKTLAQLRNIHQQSDN